MRKKSCVLVLIMLLCCVLVACNDVPDDKGVRMERDLSVDTSSPIGLYFYASDGTYKRYSENIGENYFDTNKPTVAFSTAGFPKQADLKTVKFATTQTNLRRKSSRRATTFAPSIIANSRKVCPLFSTIYGWDLTTATRLRADLQESLPHALKTTTKKSDSCPTATARTRPPQRRICSQNGRAGHNRRKLFAVQNDVCRSVFGRFIHGRYVRRHKGRHDRKRRREHRRTFDDGSGCRLHAVSVGQGRCHRRLLRYAYGVRPIP